MFQLYLTSAALYTISIERVSGRAPLARPQLALLLYVCRITATTVSKTLVTNTQLYISGVPSELSSTHTLEEGGYGTSERLGTRPELDPSSRW